MIVLKREHSLTTILIRNMENGLHISHIFAQQTDIEDKFPTAGFVINMSR